MARLRHRMPEGNHAIWIDFGRIKTKFMADITGLGGKRFVRFNDIKVGDGDAGPVKRILLAGTGPTPMISGGTAAKP